MASQPGINNSPPAHPRLDKVPTRDQPSAGAQTSDVLTEHPTSAAERSISDPHSPDSTSTSQPAPQVRIPSISLNAPSTIDFLQPPADIATNLHQEPPP